MPVTTTSCERHSLGMPKIKEMDMSIQEFARQMKSGIREMSVLLDPKAISMAEELRRKFDFEIPALLKTPTQRS